METFVSLIFKMNSTLKLNKQWKKYIVCPSKCKKSDVMCAMPYFNKGQIGKLSYAEFGGKIYNRNTSLDEWDNNTLFNTCMAILNLYSFVSVCNEVALSKDINFSLLCS